MTNKRNFQRIAIELTARCAGGDLHIKNCKISEISREGLLLQLCVTKRLYPGATLVLEIEIPGREHPINCLCKLKWVKEDRTEPKYTVVAGGKMTMINPGDRENLLDYAYAQMLKEESA